MNLTALPAFTDNYIWLVDDGTDAVAIDPGDARPVIDHLERQRLNLRTILLTHHHPDHIGGVAELKARSGDQIAVHGPGLSPIPQTTHALMGGERLEILGQTIDVVDVPGHTLDHLTYLWRRGDQPTWMFCGDTLFSAGCGRLFEGTPEQMVASLGRLAAEPEDTWICCAHEYTLSNLRFATAVEPDNLDIQQQVQRCQAMRERGEPTLPARLATERLINPFLREQVPSVVAQALQQGATSTDRHEVWAALRRWKNNFR